MGWLTGALGLIGNLVSGFFGLKQAQGQAVQGAIGLVDGINTSEAQDRVALANIIATEAASGSVFTNSWRPLTMYIFLGIVVSAWWGYVPPAFNQPMTPMLAEIFGIIKLGLGGYMGARTVEKIVGQINISRVLNRWIEKKFA